MPGFAARVGDQTSHGGSITGPGVSTVLIGGKPAAVLGDTQACPLVSGNVPHGSTPFLPPGVPIVLIGGKPALTQNDAAPAPCGATILLGCPTVIIGTNPPIVRMKAGKAAAAGAGEVSRDNKSQDQQDTTWIEIEMTEEDGDAAAHVKYKVIDAEGNEKAGYLDNNGCAKVQGLNPGTSRLSFPDLNEDMWYEA